MTATIAAAALAALWLAFSHAVLPRLFRPWHPTINYIYGTVTIGVCLTIKALLTTGSLTVADYWIVLAGAGFGTIVLGYLVDKAAGWKFELQQAWRAYKAAQK